MRAHESNDGTQLCLGFGIPTMTPQGDGSFVVRPGKPVSLLRVAEAARMLCVSRDTVYRAINAGRLEVQRPGPKSTRIVAGSLEAFRTAVSDLEYWEREGKAEG